MQRRFPSVAAEHVTGCFQNADHVLIRRSGSRLWEQPAIGHEARDCESDAYSQWQKPLRQLHLWNSSSLFGRGNHPSAIQEREGPLLMVPPARFMLPLAPGDGKVASSILARWPPPSGT
jgi:hypothetical protein